MYLIVYGNQSILIVDMEILAPQAVDLSIKTAKRPKWRSHRGRCGGGRGFRDAENHRKSLLFGTWLDWGCGLTDIYILEWVMYALP